MITNQCQYHHNIMTSLFGCNRNDVIVSVVFGISLLAAIKISFEEQNLLNVSVLSLRPCVSLPLHLFWRCRRELSTKQVLSSH